MRKALFFLGVLNDGDLDWLIAQGNKADIAAGSILIHQGQPIGPGNTGGERNIRR